MRVVSVRRTFLDTSVAMGARFKAPQRAIRFHFSIRQDGPNTHAIAEFGMEDNPRTPINAETSLEGADLSLQVDKSDLISSLA
jgi:hypothetical protein